MANTNADAISGGSAAGGIFNLSDAALIALVLLAGPMATDTATVLIDNGALTISAGETWGVLTG